MKIVKNYLRYLADLFNPKQGNKIYSYKTSSLWLMIVITAVIISVMFSAIYTSEVYSFVDSINSSNFASFRLNSDVIPKREMNFGFAYFSSGKNLKTNETSNVSNSSKTADNVSSAFMKEFKSRISKSVVIYNNTLYYSSFPCFSDRLLCSGSPSSMDLDNISFAGNGSRDKTNLASMIAMNGFLMGIAIVIFILAFAFVMAFSAAGWLLASFFGLLFVSFKKSSISFKTVMKIALFLAGILEIMFALFWVLLFHSIIVPFLIYAAIVMLVLFIESSNRDLQRKKKNKKGADDYA